MPTAAATKIHEEHQDPKVHVFFLVNFVIFVFFVAAAAGTSQSDYPITRGAGEMAVWIR